MVLATGDMEVCSSTNGGLAIQGGPSGTFVRVSCREAHTCTRFCKFRHELGNLYVCVSSGASHICDQTCQQRVRLDPYTSQCRLSGKTFEESHERQVALHKRPSEVELDQLQTKKPHSTMNGGSEHMEIDHTRGV
eukprot:jgi/Botrbrau1/17979/Bobra.50_1s0068.1